MRRMARWTCSRVGGWVAAGALICACVGCRVVRVYVTTYGDGNRLELRTGQDAPKTVDMPIQAQATGIPGG